MLRNPHPSFSLWGVSTLVCFYFIVCACGVFFFLFPWSWVQMFIYSLVVNISESALLLLSSYCSPFGGKCWQNADSRALAVNGYQQAFSPANCQALSSVVLRFCPRLIAGFKEWMASTKNVGLLEYCSVQKDSLIFKVNNSCVECVRALSVLLDV